MDPDRYYKYSDLGTVDDPKAKNVSKIIVDESVNGSGADDADKHSAEDIAVKATDIHSIPDTDTVKDDDISLVYSIDQLSIKRPGAVLASGYGNLLKSVVKVANSANVHPLYTTGTDDKLKAFSFGNTATVISLGKHFDGKLFGNECSILQAADACGARTILWAEANPPSELLAYECERRSILLLVPNPTDRSFLIWEKAPLSDEAKEAYVERGEVEWRKCPHCGLSYDKAHIVSNGYVCPSCKKLYRLTTDERIAITFDKDSFEEWDKDIVEKDPIGYPDYDGVLKRASERSGYDEAVRTGKAKIKGMPVATAIMEPSFIMGSMGSYVGERITRMIEHATAEKLPVIIFCASGGARMQEGLASLMQMAKISAAIEAHDRQNLLYISVLTDPTTGGVTASFATLGDIILSEPGALIGFAGRRVIQDTIKQALPDDFQTAEFALEHGLIDAIAPRNKMRDMLAQILRMHDPDASDSTLNEMDYTEDVLVDLYASGDPPDDGAQAIGDGADGKDNLKNVPEKIGGVTIPRSLRGIVGNLTELADQVGKTVSEQTSNAGLRWILRNQGVADIPSVKPASNNPKFSKQQSKLQAEGPNGQPISNHAWESVQLARNAHRPTSDFYIASLVDDFIEFHGDRCYADDGAIIGGIGCINGRPVTIIAEEKGSDLKSRIARNFGSPHPEGYRKAQRLMKQAEKFGRPIICFVDTQGAFCGKEAEERGMGNAIAESLSLMAGLRVPVISIVIGEGGSGGALALAVANRVAMQENAVYSVLSPEGFASILWKDGSRAAEAASVMKMSAVDAYELGMIEDVISEGQDPAHENPDQAAAAIWIYITSALDELSKLDPDEIVKQRYERFRRF